MIRKTVKRPSQSTKKYVRAADFGYDESDDIADAVDDLADTAEDLQDSVTDIEEDDDSIEVDNNIANHYIAECDRCHGIFISAVVVSDQEVESVSGICPLCGKESEQLLKWVIKDASDALDVEVPEPISEPEPAELDKLDEEANEEK